MKMQIEVKGVIPFHDSQYDAVKKPILSMQPDFTMNYVFG